MKHDLPIAGIDALWAQTLGDPGVVVAVLDGAADLGHPCFDGADVRVDAVCGEEPAADLAASADSALAHGTHVTSVIFGQHGSEVRGIAPACRGVVIPIFRANEGNGAPRPCSQLDLARAISRALELGARVINISAGQPDGHGEPHPVLARVLETCHRHGALVIAAAGNDGCCCVQIPAATPTALAVGALDHDGRALHTSNWGVAYGRHGVLAPGQDIAGAAVSGGHTLRTGTSFATALVSGVAALLLSLQRQQGRSQLRSREVPR